MWYLIAVSALGMVVITPVPHRGSEQATYNDCKKLEHATKEVYKRARRETIETMCFNSKEGKDYHR